MKVKIELEKKCIWSLWPFSFPNVTKNPRQFNKQHVIIVIYIQNASVNDLALRGRGSRAVEQNTHTDHILSSRQHSQQL